MIQAQHQRVIDRLTAQFQHDPRFPALIIAGSVAAGRAQEGSDVDIFLVATEEDWARRQPEKDIFYFTTEFSDYPGGYVDGKVVDLAFLRETAEHGSEPLRAAFTGAFPAYTRLPEVAELLPRIPVYPEVLRREKIVAYYSQVLLLNDYITAGFEQRNGVYVVAQAAAHMVHYGARLLLAHNHMLYPGWKWCMRVVEEAPEKPAGFRALADALLRMPCQAHAEAFRDCLRDFHDWEVTFPQAVSRFIDDVEWHWRRGNPYIYNW